MRRVMALQLVTFVLIAVALGLALWQINRNTVLARQGKQAHAALCVFKKDLGRRMRAGQEFIDRHPSGFAGISAAEIQRTVDAQRSTLRSLAGLRCGA